MHTCIPANVRIHIVADSWKGRVWNRIERHGGESGRRGDTALLHLYTNLCVLFASFPSVRVYMYGCVCNTWTHTHTHMLTCTYMHTYKLARIRDERHSRGGVWQNVCICTHWISRIWNMYLCVCVCCCLHACVHAFPCIRVGMYLEPEAIWIRVRFAYIHSQTRFAGQIMSVWKDHDSRWVRAHRSGRTAATHKCEHSKALHDGLVLQSRGGELDVPCIHVLYTCMSTHRPMYIYIYIYVVCLIICEYMYLYAYT